MAALELQAGDDREQVGVAAPLAVAVGRALHVQAAGRDTRPRELATAQAASLWKCTPIGPARRPRRSPPSPASDLGHDRGHVVGQRAAVGVAQRQRVGARPRWPRPARPGRSRGRPGSRRRSARRRTPPAGRPPPCRRPTRRTMARFSSRVVRSASSTCSVHALPTRVTIGVSRRQQRGQVGVVVDARGAAAGSRRTRPAARSGAPATWPASKNSASLGLEPGQPPSITSTPRLSSAIGHPQLVGDRQVQPDLLRAVAQRGVVDLDLRCACQRSGPPRRS